LIVGTAAGYFMHIPQRAIVGVMAFGSGALISALSLELMDDAFRHGGFDSS
jgi:zinc transporter, ZIP family